MILPLISLSRQAWQAPQIRASRASEAALDSDRYHHTGIANGM